MFGFFKRKAGRKVVVTGVVQSLKALAGVAAVWGLDVPDKLVENIGQFAGLLTEAVIYFSVSVMPLVWEFVPVVTAWWARSSESDPPMETIEQKRGFKR